MRLLFITLLALTLSQTFSQDCSNPLLTKLGLTSTGTPIIPTGAKYCKKLANSATAISCCSVDTLNTFQTKIDELKNNIQGMAGKRDTIIRASLKNNDLAAFQDAVTKFSAAATNVAQQAATKPNGTEIALSLSLVASVMSAASSQIAGQFTNVGAQLGDYQLKRVTCFKRVLRMQAAALCLACDANWATMGVDSTSGNITLNNNTCYKLQADCVPYLNATGVTSVGLAIRKLVKIFQKMTDVMNGWISGTIPWPTNLNSTAMGENAFVPDSPVERPVEIPTGCDDVNNPQACKWVCEAFFMAGKINPNVASQGGEEIDDSKGLGRLLIEEQQPSRRNLATGEWEYDDDDAGTTVDVVADPSPDNSGIKTVFSAFAVLWVSIVYLFV